MLTVGRHGAGALNIAQGVVTSGAAILVSKPVRRAR